MKQVLLLLTTMILLNSGCVAISPEKMKDHLQIVLPQTGKDNSKYPVMFIFQGSGGGTSHSRQWANIFREKGIASVIIDSLSARGVKNLYKVNYGSDISSALEIASHNPKLNLTQYGLIGFSKGGTAALLANTYIQASYPQPQFIFALYPGAYESCPNTYNDSTKVFVFYGKLDDWGRYRGNHSRGAMASCIDMAKRNENAEIILFEDAHHGYDGIHTGSFNCCGGGTFRYAPNQKAKDETIEIVLNNLMNSWQLQ